MLLFLHGVSEVFGYKSAEDNNGLASLDSKMAIYKTHEPISIKFLSPYVRTATKFTATPKYYFIIASINANINSLDIYHRQQHMSKTFLVADALSGYLLSGYDHFPEQCAPLKIMLNITVLYYSKHCDQPWVD